MKTKRLGYTLSLSLTIAISLISACQTPIISNVPALNGYGIYNNAVTSIIGTAEFPVSKSFTTKATLSDVGTKATVSLLYPSSDPTNPNMTIATGLTDINGNFTINLKPTFSPAINEVFVLEASKRIGGGGNALMSIRTYVKWSGIGWDSMTNSGVFINSKTTALSIIADNNKDKIKPSDTIKRIDNSSGTSIPLSIGGDKVAYFTRSVYQNGVDKGNIYVANSDGTGTPVNITNDNSTFNDLFNSVFSWSPDGSKIVYSSFKTGEKEIFVANSNGTGTPVNFSNNNISDDNNPVWSPEGSVIAFEDGANIFAKWSLSVNGFNINLTPGFQNPAGFPVWSPDSSKISFTTALGIGVGDIYVANFDGTGTPVNISNLNSSVGLQTWSPNSLKIQFSNSNEIRIVNPDGKGSPIIISSATQGVWSPDGSKIAYYSDTNILDNIKGDIKVLNSNGTGTPINISNDNSIDRSYRYSWALNASKIIYTSNKTGNYEIYSANSDGTGVPVNISNNSAVDYFSIASDDGINVAFSSFRTGNANIYVTKTDGTGTPINLSQNSLFNSSPRWKPVLISSKAVLDLSTLVDYCLSNNIDPFQYIVFSNGKYTISNPKPIQNNKIFFNSSRDSGNGINFGLWSMDSDGSNQTKLIDNSNVTMGINNAVLDGARTISPDGTKIAFLTLAGSNYDIYIMDSDGANLKRLTSAPGLDEGPSFSPDGSKIYYHSNQGSTFAQIWVMNSDGSNKTPLTNDSTNPIYNNYFPKVSPDGTKVIYYSIDGNLRVISSNGGVSQILTTDAADDNYESWSPNGQRIAYANNASGSTNYHIWVMNADGSNKIELTSSSDNDRVPLWSPDGRKIAWNCSYTNISNVCVMDANGGNKNDFTGILNFKSFSPTWSSDSKTIFFQEDDTPSQIYSATTAGSWSPTADSTSFRNLSTKSDIGDVSNIPNSGNDDTSPILKDFALYHK